MKCPECINKKMITVNFLYNKTTTEIIPYAGKRLMCLHCGLQREICRECNKTEDEVKLKTQMDIPNTYLCTGCMNKK